MKFFEEVTLALEHPTWKTTAVGITTFVIVFVGDYVTPEAMSFSLFYLVPIALFLWTGGRTWAWVCAVLSTIGGPVQHLVKGDFIYFSSFVPYWNVLILIGFYAAFIGSLTNVKRYLMQTIRTNEELRATLTEVKQLRGLLPICSSCKKIRDESQRWIVMEKYIQSRTDAKFSHGLCPDCMKVLYPDYDPTKNQ